VANADLPLRSPQASPLRGRLSFAYRDRPPERGNRCWTYANGYSLYLLESGRARFRFDDGPFSLEAGNWGCLPAQRRRYQAFSEDARLLSVRFEAAWEEGEPLFEAGLPTVFSRVQGRALEVAARELLEAMGRARAEAAGPGAGLVEALRLEAAWKGFLAEWATALLAFGLRPSAPDAVDRRIVAARRILDLARPITVVPYATLEEGTGLGPSQIDRLFRRETGRTPKRYLDEAALARAKSRLDDRAQPIKALAADLGFSDSAHFTRWFKRLSGQTPLAYRKYGDRQA